MRIAVTGGRGLMGRALCRHAVSHGHEITSIDLTPAGADAAADGVTHAVADVTDYEQFAAAIDGCEALVHLAAFPSPNGRPAHVVHNDNVRGSYNALYAGFKAGMTHMCLASSINAIGGVYSREPRYDYFPLDEGHPTYAEDPYSLSKWICEAQGDSVTRRYEHLSVSSLRFHRLITGKHDVPPLTLDNGHARRDLWGYTNLEAASRAALAALTAEWTGHEAFYIVAPDTLAIESSAELHRTAYPGVPLRAPLEGRQSFFSSAKAERLLGWKHDI